MWIIDIYIKKEKRIIEKVRWYPQPVVDKTRQRFYQVTCCCDLKFPERMKTTQVNMTTITSRLPCSLQNPQSDAIWKWAKNHFRCTHKRHGAIPRSCAHTAWYAQRASWKINVRLLYYCKRKLAHEHPHTSEESASQQDWCIWERRSRNQNLSRVSFYVLNWFNLTGPLRKTATITNCCAGTSVNRLRPDVFYTNSCGLGPQHIPQPPA